MNIEPLEARIAPAKLLSLIDVDGDLITITTTTGTDAELLAVVTTIVPASGAVPGGGAINTINLQSNPAAFDGTSLSVTAKRGPLGGDGLVNVITINALGLDLGTLTVKGNLAILSAGKSTDKIAAISVNATTSNTSWNILGSVGTLTVKTDVLGTNIGIAGDRLDTLTIGGSLIGLDSSVSSGIVQVPNGTIGKVTIGGSIVGSTQDTTGRLLAKSIGSATVGGSILGGGGSGSGLIGITGTAGTLGAVTIRGDVRGGGGADSGRIVSNGALGAVTIGGSVLGGAGGGSGIIDGTEGIGKVRIGHDLAGGTNAETGLVISSSGGIAGVTIGGGLLGGPNIRSGGIVASGGNIGPVSIRGDVQGGPADSAGNFPADAGIILAKIGSSADMDFASIASITIGGSVVGRGVTTDGQIYADGDIGPVKIGGDLRGGSGARSGDLSTGRSLGQVTIGGSVLGGSGIDSGGIAANGKLAGVKIGGSLVGSDSTRAGRIFGDSVGPIAILGDFIGGSGISAGTIRSNGSLDAISIGGSVLPGSGHAGIVGTVALGPVDNSNLNLKSLTIAGSATGLIVNIGGEDGIIGPVKVGGDWREGSIYTAVTPGGSGFGTNGDTAIGIGDPLLFSKIVSITIGGAVIGTADSSSDHFGFVAQEIGALSIGGTKIPLLAGHGTDTDANLSRYILSASRDFTVHEVL